MGLFTGKTVEDAVRLSNILKETDQIKSEVAEVTALLRDLHDRVTRLEALQMAEREVRAAQDDRLRAEVQTLALREVQRAVNAVQGSFHQNLSDLRLDLDRIASGRSLALPGPREG